VNAHRAKEALADVNGGAYGLQGFLLGRSRGDMDVLTLEEYKSEHVNGISSVVYGTKYIEYHEVSTLEGGYRYIAITASGGSHSCGVTLLFGVSLPDSWINPQVDPQFYGFDPNDTGLNVGVQPESVGKEECRPMPRNGANYPTEYITYKIYDLEADL
jgi:hypothetical protein